MTAERSTKPEAQKLIEQRIKELHEKTDFMMTIFHNLEAYAIVACDFDGEILAYNKGSRLMYKYKPEEIIGKIEYLVIQRLNELTPDMVKKIVQDMIHQHPGWLVIWGGVFGGFIGLITGFMR